ncbi:cell wall / vacuolar inhibitor of fructosidase 1 [Carica papaya]|uniref:cell wall / vacuolar inhibitor of fructosidase 1 n=1 Tax=Carica papaya TaxID=3649 RepID=UPI000B8C8D5F|nr:cell wall / vacuolar inhibitor of fructosidase 1 [Carica papaya]
MKMKTKLLVSLQIFSLIVSSPNVDSSSLLPLIDSTCKQTPFYDLCVSNLQSDPRSSTADTNGLGVVVVGKIEAKSAETLNAINGLIKQKPELSQALNSCAGKYNAIIKGDVPQATEAFQKNDPKFAEDAANDAANEADSCEKLFSGRSPITSSNTLVNQLSLVAAAIAKLLL